MLDSGADVNAKGGESFATPAMWAAQRCHYYVVNLLLQYGADPLLVDVQGYNILHLATIDGNAFLLTLLLHQEIPVDVVDPQGHTGLMWAAYKGFPACVDLFLRWGANVNAIDEGGLTPLHWALVKGSLPCLQRIIEYGADRFAKTRDGKTPSIVADEMRTTRVWHRALSECGYDTQGNTKGLPFGLATLARNKKFASKYFFLWPFLIVPLAIWTLSNLIIYVSVPLTLLIIFGMQWIAQQVANLGPPEYRLLQRTVRACTCYNLDHHNLFALFFFYKTNNGHPGLYSPFLQESLLALCFGWACDGCLMFYLVSFEVDRINWVL